MEFSIRTTTSLLRPVSGFQVEGVGNAIDVSVRLLAALFFGLFVLAMRNRIHR